jgi:hypothetical protein
VAALSRACDPLHGLDANDGRDDRIFEAVIGFAEVFLHGLGVEATSDLLGGRDRELATSDLDEAPAFKFVLEQLALGLCTFQDGVGQRRVSKVVKAGWGYDREIRSLGHGFTPLAWVRAGQVYRALVRLVTLWHHKVMKSTLSSAKKPKMGRPTVDSEAVNVRIARDALETIDDWRRKQADLPGRPEAIRRLIELGLKVKK